MKPVSKFTEEEQGHLRLERISPPDELQFLKGA
jgi:hypothetical protein